MASYAIDDLLLDRELDRLSSRMGFVQPLKIPRSGALNLNVGKITISLELDTDRKYLLVSSSQEISPQDEYLVEKALAYSAYKQAHFKVLTASYVDPYLIFTLSFRNEELNAENLEKAFLELVRINEEIFS